VKKLLLIVTLSLSLGSVMAQTTTEGTEFWFGFMENQTTAGSPVLLEVYISAKETANVTINTQRGFNATVVVQPGNTELVQIPFSFMPTTEGVSNRGIQVLSDTPISVYQLNKRQFSADAAVILPNNAIGKEYYVTAHMEPPGDIVDGARESQMLIVAIEDGTEVEIIPSVETFGGLAAGVSEMVTLNAGDSYLIKSNFDLTGTFVRTVNNETNDCKNVAVYGGNVFTNVGGCGPARDHLIEQMFPISTWGQNFVYVPYATRQDGDYIKILASEDGTQVNISGLPVVNLDAGEVYINKELPGVRTITADKPISLAQFSRSTECDGVDADPFMIIVSPIEQRVQEVTFSAFSVEEIDQYYLTVITEASALASGVVLDGFDITGTFTINGDFAYSTRQISQGDHTVSAPEGVIAYVYGFGVFESFGYSAGVSLEKLNLEILGDDEFIGEIFSVACVNADIAFDASFETEPGEEPRYDRFSWDFGNGDVLDGQQVTYNYDQPGEYVVTLLASKGAVGCATSETINRTITIIEVEAEEIQGPTSVCPDVSGIAYTIQGPTDNTYQWEAVGGNVVGGQGTDQVFIDWGDSRDDAAVLVTPFNGLGCRGETMPLNVLINRRLEPPAPTASSQGQTEVCFSERNNVMYTTPPTNGSSYEWFIEGGDFVTSRFGSEVTVNWGNSTAGRIWYKEDNPLIVDCEGFSDTLNVTIYPEIVDTGIINDALCNGDANGSITLDISGGKGGPYQVIWDNGLIGTQINGLSAGNYTATITDALGCEVTSEVYTINEPDILEFAAAPTVVDIGCFQETNGSIQVNVQGGTAPYRYNWSREGFTRTTSDPLITNLAAGMYSLEVIDANDCAISLTNIIVEEPLLLEADIESLINDPVCPDAENGTAFIDAKGGTPDYQFFWSNNPTVDNQVAEGLAQGTYTLEIFDANGCSANYTLEQGERDPNLFVPNAFSPNGDGVNDVFRPVADCDIVYSMQIFNKWGAVVFSTNKIEEGWDGTFNGASVQKGKYSYVIFWSAEINGVQVEQNIRGSLNIYQ